MERSELEQRLREVLASQRMGVLATESGGQPHTSLVAIAGTDDLTHLVFCTSRETRKYQNLKANARVSLLVDTRSNRESDVREAIAVSAIGEAFEIERPDELRDLTAVYVAKHRHLADFASAPGKALVRVDVSRYLLNTLDKSWALHVGHDGIGGRTSEP